LTRKSIIGGVVNKAIDTIKVSESKVDFFTIYCHPRRHIIDSAICVAIDDMHQRSHFIAYATEGYFVEEAGSPLSYKDATRKALLNGARLITGRVRSTSSQQSSPEAGNGNGCASSVEHSALAGQLQTDMPKGSLFGCFDIVT